MSDADDLARRYLAVWTQYLTTLLADPRTMDTLKRWQAFTEQFTGAAPQAAKMPFSVWPPFFGPLGPGLAPPAAGGEAVEGFVRQVEELERRFGDFERRLAALENRPRARRGSSARKPRPVKRD